MQNTLFYDGNCALCSHEIRALKRLKKNKHLSLINIHSNECSQLADERTNHELLAIVDLKTKKDRWLYGLDATVTAWRHTPIGFLFIPLRWPIIRNIADPIYARWA